MTIHLSDITVTVPGLPVGQPRGRALVNEMGDVRVITATGDHPVLAYRDAIAWAVRKAMGAAAPFKSPVLSVIFGFPFSGHVRKRKPNPVRPHLARPDIDNLLKAVMDGLQEGGAFKDDCCVWQLSVVRKVRLRPGEKPHTVISLHEGTIREGVAG